MVPRRTRRPGKGTAARNAPVSLVAIPERGEPPNNQGQICLGADGHIQIDDRLCRQLWHRRAPRVLDGDRNIAKRGGYGRPQSREENRPRGVIVNHDDRIRQYSPRLGPQMALLRYTTSRLPVQRR